MRAKIRELCDGFFCPGKAGESRPNDDDDGAGKDVRRRFSLLLPGEEVEEEGGKRCSACAVPSPANGFHRHRCPFWYLRCVRVSINA